MTYNESCIWTEEEIKKLRDNYKYYINHEDEAESFFQKDISSIRSLIVKIINKEMTLLTQINNRKFRGKEMKPIDENVIIKDLLEKSKIVQTHNRWNDEQIKELKEKYFYYLKHKEEAENYFKRKWFSIHCKARQLKITSRKINKECTRFLGEHIAERVLNYVFKDVDRMPNGNIGFDLLCNKGYKIDSKSSCLRRNNTYDFNVNCNKIADYFLCIGFDNREDLNPQHIWLIKSDETLSNCKKINECKNLSITNTIEGLSKFSKYELTDKLKETISCCNTLKLKSESKGDQ